MQSILDFRCPDSGIHKIHIYWLNGLDQLIKQDRAFCRLWLSYKVSSEFWGRERLFSGGNCDGVFSISTPVRMTTYPPKLRLCTDSINRGNLEGEDGLLERGSAKVVHTKRTGIFICQLLLGWTPATDYSYWSDVNCRIMSADIKCNLTIEHWAFLKSHKSNPRSIKTRPAQCNWAIFSHWCTKGLLRSNACLTSWIVMDKKMVLIIYWPAPSSCFCGELFKQEIFSLKEENSVLKWCYLNILWTQILSLQRS